MNISRLAVLVGGITFGAVAGAAFQLSSVSAAGPAVRRASAAASAPVALPTPSPSPTPSCPLRTQGTMVEDYGAYNGTTIRKHLPVHDVTTRTLVELFGHNAIDIVLDSGTPLYAVTSGTAYQITNWTIPGFPQGWAAVVVSDVLKDDQGDPIAFLYGHVREFDVPNGQHVVGGALLAKSGGDPDDPGAGFSDMANVHFEVIESPHPLLAHAGTVNPHQFLENLYAYAATNPARCW
ncbi:MAG: hypothetical protein E6I47_11695 [Chloroflexi bacterium]|nr:MAG: hypothetical protein E6I47_11695 [Chloroflexota bacterium]